jgi:Cu(I)/Ag(I) efflux system protein CusF
MKMITALVSCLLVAGCAQPANTETTAAAGSPPAASTEAPAAVVASQPGATAGMPMAGTPAAGSGTVESVDAAAGKISISHGPVAALGWPAMTMNFKATPEQIASVHAGQAIDFDFVADGMQGTITAIRSSDAGK